MATTTRVTGIPVLCATQVKAAREWLLDCVNPLDVDGEDTILTFDDDQIRLVTHRLWDGGLESFKAANPCEVCEVGSVVIGGGS